LLVRRIPYIAEVDDHGIGVQPKPLDLGAWYDPHTAETIRRTIFTFNYVNTKLLLIASAWAESLANRPIAGGEAVQGYISPGVLPYLPEITLVHMNEAPASIRRLLRDIAEKHHALDVASEFRTLAKYPLFLESAWMQLRDYVGTDRYSLLQSQIAGQSIKLARQMPFAVTINRQTLEPFFSLPDIAGIMGIVTMFQHFLPGLIIDGEYFRRLIGEPSATH
jgi:hypothetical protein